MNDFTKEELELILSDISQCDMEYSRTASQEALYFKIKKMVEDLCPHKKTGISYVREAREIYCFDCGNYLDEKINE